MFVESDDIDTLDEVNENIVAIITLIQQKNFPNRCEDYFHSSDHLSTHYSFEQQWNF